MKPLTRIRVVTVRTDPRNDAEYMPDVLRVWGVTGTITGYSNSHGLCFEVAHDDGTVGCYEPDELRLINPEGKP